MTNAKLNSIFEKIKGAIFLLYKPLMFTSIRDLDFTMRQYAEMVVNENHNALKRLKIYVPKFAILKAFEDIKHEYIEITQTGANKALKSRKDKYNRLVREYQILLACGTVLSVDSNNKEIVDFLNRSRIKGSDLLKTIQSELKMIQTKLDELKALDEADNKGKENKKIGFEDYESIFAVLNKNGYKSGWDMTVIGFIKTMEVYKKEVEENKRQMEQIKNRKK